jgi:hypothetical protein
MAWWQWLWLLLFMSGLVFRQPTDWEIQENPLDAWAASRVALVAITALVLAIRHALRRPAWLATILPRRVEWAWTHPECMAEMGEEGRLQYENEYTAAKNYELLMQVYKRATGSSACVA